MFADFFRPRPRLATYWDFPPPPESMVRGEKCRIGPKELFLSLSLSLPSFIICIILFRYHFRKVPPTNRNNFNNHPDDRTCSTMVVQSEVQIFSYISDCSRDQFMPRSLFRISVLKSFPSRKREPLNSGGEDDPQNVLSAQLFLANVVESPC